MTYYEINYLLIKAFMSKDEADRKAYFQAASEWLHNENVRTWEIAEQLRNELSPMHKVLSRVIEEAGTTSDHHSHYIISRETIELARKVIGEE